MENSRNNTGSVTGNRAAGQAKWTFMVYMAGDNNLDGAALRDIEEMARAGSTKNVNILVDNPVEQGAVKRNRIADLHENRHGRDAVVESVQNAVGRLLEGLPQLPDNILQDYHQRQFRIVKDLQVLHQILAHLIVSLLKLMQKEARFLQEQKIPLNWSGCGLELFAEPTAGDLFLLHEDPEDLPKTDQFRLKSTLCHHKTFRIAHSVMTFPHLL